MGILVTLLFLVLSLGAVLTLIFIDDLDKAERGEKSLFWEEKDD